MALREHPRITPHKVENGLVKKSTDPEALVKRLDEASYSII